MADSRDLARLDQVKAYIYSGQPATSLPTADDFILSRFTTAVSRWIAAYCGRNKQALDLFLAQTYTETRNGNSQQQMRLRARPIISVTSVNIEGSLITSAQGSLEQSGYVWDANFVTLRGGLWGPRQLRSFARGALNCQFVYVGGYNTPGMEATAALPGWSAATDFPQWSEITATPLLGGPSYVYSAYVGGVSGAVMPAFPTTLGATVSEGGGPTIAISQATEAGVVVTVTTVTSHEFSPGQWITISGVSIAGYNGTFQVLATPTATTFTFNAGVSGLGPGSGGTAAAQGVTWRCQSQVVPLVPSADALPEDIVLACCQQTALLYKNRGRVGDTSVGVMQDRVNFFMQDLHPTTKLLLDPYRDWAGGMEGGEIAVTYST